MATINSELESILDVLRARSEGTTRAQLLEILREQCPNLMAPQLGRYLSSAPEKIKEVDGRLFVVDNDETGPEEGPKQPLGFRRFIALDLESVVRPTVESPYREQYVFQIGAVRFGPDETWVDDDPEFGAFVQLPEEHESLIHREDIRERYQHRKRPAKDALDELRMFCQEADVLVAYNGIAHDFPLLEREYERTETQAFFDTRGGTGPRLVDGLYLAHALWPIPPRQHRLRDILDRLNVDVEEMTWHDALDDSKMLVTLLEHAAQELLPAWDPGLLSLIMAVAKGSDAWSMLSALTPNPISTEPFKGRETAEVLDRALQARTPLRPSTPEANESEKESHEAKPNSP